MPIVDYILAGKVVSVDIPNSKGELIAMKDRLRLDQTALRTRLAQGVTEIQRQQICKDLGQINAELSIVNHRLTSFKQVRDRKLAKLENKLLKYRQKLDRRGQQQFPAHADWEDKYHWCLSLLDKAIALHHARNETEMSDEVLLEYLGDSYAVAFSWERLAIAQSEMAKQYLEEEVYVPELNQGVLQ